MLCKQSLELVARDECYIEVGNDRIYLKTDAPIYKAKIEEAIQQIEGKEQRKQEELQQKIQSVCEDLQKQLQQKIDDTHRELSSQVEWHTQNVANTVQAEVENNNWN